MLLFKIALNHLISKNQFGYKNNTSSKHAWLAANKEFNNKDRR
jgi:hypothetical protein